MHLFDFHDVTVDLKRGFRLVHDVFADVCAMVNCMKHQIQMHHLKLNSNVETLFFEERVPQVFFLTFHSINLIENPEQ